MLKAEISVATVPRNFFFCNRLILQSS